MGLKRPSFFMATSFLLLLLCICSLPSFALSRAMIKDDAKVGRPVAFLQNLVGSQKGDTIDGLRHLKQYLHKFGYLHSYSPSSTTTSNTSTAARDDDEDTYDELLEAAIRTYQQNYNLDVTGKLDARTIDLMMKPRCGVPDIINGTTSMNSGKATNHHHHHHHQSHVVLHYNVNQRGRKWPKTQLTYAFLNGGSVPMRSITARAFKRWSAVTKFTFQEVRDTETADIKIGFFAGEHGDDDPFDGPGGVLAHSYYPTIGLFHLDEEESWSTKNIPGMNEMDLESVTVHEMGHLLGLAHSSDEDAVMYPTIDAGVVKRELTRDDIDGITDLYNLT